MASIDSKRYMVVRPRGKRQPLFWVQAGLIQAKVLQEMDRDQPVYCLYRLQPNPNAPPLSLEEIAAYHLETMRSLHPQGPYALAGYCVCAPIVFEMASQLRKQGEAVSALILIDPMDVAFTRARLIQEPRLFRLGFQVNRIWFHLKKISRYSMREKLAYCMTSIRAMKKRRARVVHSAERTLPQHVLLDVHDSDVYAFGNYVPQAYDGPATILRPSVSVPRIHEYPNRRWAQLVRGGLEIRKVPGDSESMWLLPQASGVAQSISACLHNPHPGLQRDVQETESGVRG